MPAAELPVVGEGRASIVYDLGDGTVLRRYRDATASAEPEAELMRLAAQAGVPVPAVHSASGPELRMDLVSGPSMTAELVEHPARAEDYGRELAALHRTLDGVRISGGPAAGLVHGDLHPGNVMMAAAGPVLVDWTNSRLGPRALDPAITWLILACFDPADTAAAADVAVVRAALLDGFLHAIDRSAATAMLDEAAAVRHADPATTPAEHTRMKELCRRHRAAP